MEDVSETWLPVSEPGYEELYEVSNLGRVRSLPRQTVKGMLGGRVLKPKKDTSGHWQVTLSRSGKQVNKSVCKLVMETFVGPRPDGMEVCHGERGQECDALSNLRYDTHKANMQDRLRDGHYANAQKEVCPHCDQPYAIRKDGKGRYCIQRETEGMARRRAAKKAASGASGLPEEPDEPVSSS